jgi:hypothetical protein
MDGNGFISRWLLLDPLLDPASPADS